MIRWLLGCIVAMSLAVPAIAQTAGGVGGAPAGGGFGGGLPAGIGGGVKIPQGGLLNGNGNLFNGNNPDVMFPHHGIQVPNVLNLDRNKEKPLSKKLGCVNCQPVPPDNVIGYIGLPYDPSTGLGYVKPDRPIPRFLTNRSDTEVTRNKECSTAVITLRTPNLDGANLIDQFHERCLLTDSGDLPFLPRVPTVETCQEEYHSFANSCVSPIQRVNPALIGRIGILISTVAGQYPRILCTATLLDGRTIITARHCVERANFPSGSDGNVPVAFLPNPALDQSSGEPHGPIAIEGEVDNHNDVRRLNLIDGMPALEADVLVLRLAKEIGLEKPGIQIVGAPVATGEKLSLIGYHDFLMRAHILKSRIDGETLASADAVVLNGKWADFIMVDDSSTCFAVNADSNEIDHFCQSFGGTSGAPLFTNAVEDGRQTFFYLAGVQSRGSLADDETTGQSNQAAVVVGILSQLGFQRH